MVTLDTVYWKFGYASEAAQLLETELINVITEYDMSQGKDIQSLKKQFLEMDKYTLGKLNYALKSRMVEDADTLEYVSDALKARNYLAHDFFRAHNFAKDTPAGRQKMLDDLQKTHNIIFEAYRKVLLISGIKIPPLGDD
ncbi:hypothetical protein FNW83_22845 [Escherichia coli]|nr:hypothetical protein [Escherichia coli]HBC1285511.1 hypothetical protein [Escherichia coli]